MNTNMQNTYPGKGFICSCCDSIFDGGQCPNCGSTSFQKTQDFLKWEAEQNMLDSQYKLIDKLTKYANNANTNNYRNNTDNNSKQNKGIQKAFLIVFLICVGSFCLEWILTLFFFMK